MITSRQRRALLTAVLTVASLSLVAAVPASDVVPSAAAADGARHDGEHVLVAFDPGSAAAERAAVHAQNDGRVVNRMEWLELDVVEIRNGADPVEVSARYERNPLVAYAHPNWEVSLLSTPNDPLFADEWGLHSRSDVDIDAPEGWDLAYGPGNFPNSGGTRVGVLDTGIDQTHVDLQGKTKACAQATLGTGVILSGCHDDNLHGTHVAGTVAAVTNNATGVAGVAPDAELAVFKALNAAGSGFYADVIAGIHWLHTTGQSRIISMSLGGPQDDALDAELTEAAEAGVLLIAAAGNDGDATESWPAYHADVMSVSAIDSAGNKADFSTCNGDVEIAAPGAGIWSTTPGSTYLALDGTSMATPHVSGVAAVVMEAKGYDATTTRNTLRSSTELPGNCNGVGVVNLALALGGSGGGGGGGTTDPGEIAGTVTEHRTRNPIGGAKVDCGTAGSATTESDGTYAITSVTPGSYSCTASATGYRSKASSVTVQSGTRSTLDFVLRKR